MLNGEYYALKITPKYNLNIKGRLNSLLNEPTIMKNLNKKSLFIPQLISSFQDYENMYLVTTFYDGPTLIKLKYENVSEEQIKFVSACIIQAFKCIRENKIIHRDLSFFNIMMDKDNYFNLIDFSFSVFYSKRKSKDLKCNYEKIDTPPEILNNSDYDYNSDYYRLGYIIFFWVFKESLYKYKNIENITKLFEDYNIKKKYSKELMDFLESIIKKNIKTRLGYNNINELIKHPWFYGFNWKKLETRQIISPFKNVIRKKRNIFCKVFKKSQKKLKMYLNLTRIKNYRTLLKNFDYSYY